MWKQELIEVLPIITGNMLAVFSRSTRWTILQKASCDIRSLTDEDYKRAQKQLSFKWFFSDYKIFFLLERYFALYFRLWIICNIRYSLFISNWKETTGYVFIWQKLLWKSWCGPGVFAFFLFLHLFFRIFHLKASPRGVPFIMWSAEIYVIWTPLSRRSVKPWNGMFQPSFRQHR